MNGFLLDTNAFLFVISRSDRVAADRMAALLDQPRRVSQVCAIEVAVKQGIGKLRLPPPFETDFGYAFTQMAGRLGAEVIDIDLRHIAAMARLPLVHRDPFDRLIIAQALTENLTVITRDRTFLDYAGLKVLRI